MLTCASVRGRHCANYIKSPVKIGTNIQGITILLKHAQTYYVRLYMFAQH